MATSRRRTSILGRQIRGGRVSPAETVVPVLSTARRGILCGDCISDNAANKRHGSGYRSLGLVSLHICKFSCKPTEELAVNSS
jgi:hypothetical protein